MTENASALPEKIPRSREARLAVFRSRCPVLGVQCAVQTVHLVHFYVNTDYKCRGEGVENQEEDRYIYA